MSEPIRYMVVCDHPEEKRRYFVADIDDDRPIGGTVRFDLYRGGFGALVEPANKRGARITVPFTCGASGCKRHVELRETSLPDLLDKIGPHRDALFPVEDFPVFERPSAQEVERVLLEGADPAPGVIVGHERRYVMPFDKFCEAVSMMRDRGRR